MNIVTAIKLIQQWINTGDPKQLSRAAALAIISSTIEGYDQKRHGMQLCELAQDWWATFELLPEHVIHQVDASIVVTFRDFYPPEPHDIPSTHPSALTEPVTEEVNASLDPITDDERDLILSSLDTEDSVREVFENIGAVSQNGRLPLTPLLVVEELVVFGHVIVNLYRDGSIDRTWGVNRRRWEYQFIEDTLIARTVTEGRLSGHARNTYARFMKPCLPLLTERQILSHARRIERDLVKRGLMERVNRQTVRCTELGEAEAIDDLIPAWLEFAIEEPF
jgi:hypothetical protein